MNNKTLVEKIKAFPQLSICVGYIIMFVLLTVLSGDFLTTKNILNVLRQTSSTMIVAVGMTFVLITGGIDLSVGSVAALSATLSVAFMVNYQLPVLVSIILGLLIGAGCGLVNGLVI